MITKIFLNQTLILILNFFKFCINLKKNFKNFKSKKKSSKKKSLVFEFYFSDMFMVALFLLLGYINRDKYNIIFFFYSKNFIKKNIIYFTTNFFLKKLENYIDIKLINTYSRKKGNNSIAEKIYRKIKKKDDIYKINYKGIIIGKYIYQSYCRDYLEYTVNLGDKRLKRKIEDAINIFDNVNILFRKSKVESLFLSHTVFSKYGIVASLAKKYKSKIYIFYKLKNNRFKILKIAKNLVQGPDYKNFKNYFRQQKDKRYLINYSKKALRSLMFGKPDLIFRKKGRSSFNKNKEFELSNDKRKKIIILPSCFFDALSFFEKSLFVDNYTWLKHLLTKSKLTNFDWYIKPHPDGMSSNNRVYKKILKDFPHVKLLNKDISNRTFLKNKFVAMFTFQSNAVLEFTYMGIPTVMVSDNYHSKFSYGKPVLNLNQFNKKIINADRLKVKNEHFKEIHEFNSINLKDRYKKIYFTDLFKVSPKKKISLFSNYEDSKILFKKNFLSKNQKKIEKFFNQI